MERPNLSVSVSLLRPQLCTQGIHQTNENSYNSDDRLIIFLDDCLILALTREEAEMARDTLIFVLQHLGFTVNIQKISSTTNTDNSVSGSGNQLKHLDIMPSSRKSGKDCDPMSKNFYQAQQSQ